MATIFDMAKAFLSIESMTNKKLQKLCYYSKAWHLALYGENIISEEFQAWVHGPVCPELYDKYKEYGYNKIPIINSTKDIPETFISFAKEVYDVYGDLTGDELERLTHMELPWINARGELKTWMGSQKIISEEDMKEYYRREVELGDGEQ